MAYAFRLPADVTGLIYDMRDWRLEKVRAEGGTPIARLMRSDQAPSVSIWRTPPPPTYVMENGVPRDEWAWTRPFVEAGGVGSHWIHIRDEPFPCLTYGNAINPTRCYTDLARPAADLWWQCEPCGP